MSDKYRVFYGVNASHTFESEFFKKLSDAKAFMYSIKDKHYFTLYKFDKLEPVWDSMMQADKERIAKMNDYRRKRGYHLLEEINSRYSI